jgi:hypothetical protein
VQENIAVTIRHGWRPPEIVSEVKDLSSAAQRLNRALETAKKWMDVAQGGDPELRARAEMIRDQIAEELAKVCFEMEVRSCVREWGEASEERAKASAIEDHLLAAYNVLSDAPVELFSDGSPRARYALMGAILAAIDAAGTTGARA